MKIILLTHERELEKPTNTGKLVKAHMLQDCELIVWRRKEPDSRLLALLTKQQAVLLFPKNELPDSSNASVTTHVASVNATCFSSYSHYVILDATWQQAKKMYRQSPYLQNADKLALDQAPVSSFQRRRNQREGGLCTAECVIELLKLSGRSELADAIAIRYESFNFQ